MNRLEIIKKNKNLLISISILIIFIVMFCIASNIYTLSSRRSQTVILKESLQNIRAEDKKLSISKAAKLDVSYHMMDPHVIDKDSLVFTTYADNTNRLSIINLKDSKLTEIDKGEHSNLGGLSVSKNGEQLIYSDYGTDGTNVKTYIYDIRNKSIKNVIDASSYTNQLLSSSKYIGANPDYLFLTDINTNKKENLADIKNLRMSLDDTMNRKLQMIFDLKVSTDGKTLFFRTLFKRAADSSIIFTLNIENKKLTKYNIEGTLYDVEPLDNDNLLICGSLNKINGLFIYNMSTKRYKTLIHGMIYNVDISSDRKKIAYTLHNDNKYTELYAATLNRNSIEANTMLLSDIKYISFFEWNEDGTNLFSVSEGMEGSTIYRFTF